MRPALLAALVVLGCGKDGEVRRTSHLVHEVEVEEAGDLVAYSWDGGAPVSARSVEGTIGLDLREAGLTPDTVLYLPFHEPGDVGPHEYAVEVSECEPTDGRTGPGLRFPTGGSFVRAYTPVPEAFTIELRARREEVAHREVHLAGVSSIVTLGVMPSGSVRLRVGTAQAAESRATLALDRWSHVAVAYDPADLGQARLVVDGEVQLVKLPAGFVVPEGPLTLGEGFVGSLDDVRMLSRAASTAELIERGRGERAPGQHELDLLLDPGRRTVRLWTPILERPQLLTREDFERGELRHVGWRDGRLVWMPASWQRDRPRTRPRARTTHPTVYVGEHRAFVFGGETRDTHVGRMVNTNDTWLYRIDERSWERVASEAAPAPRCHQAAAWSPDHRMVLLAGGARNDGGDFEAYDDTWAFFPDDGRWYRLAPEGDPLPAVSDSGLVYDPIARRFVLLTDWAFFEYDPAANRWTQTGKPEAVDEHGEPVDYRPGGSFMAAYDPGSGKIVVFGGEYPVEDGYVFQDVTALYDRVANRFEVRYTGTGPSPRVRSAFAYDSKHEQFVLFGGVRGEGSQREGDLWTYSVDDDQWRRLDAANAPSARGGYFGMAYDPELDAFVVLCGRHDPDRFLDEAWRLRIDPEATGKATWVFDRAAFPSASPWYAEWLAPSGSEVVFRFRGSEDGVRWRSWAPSAPKAIGPRMRYVKVEARLDNGDADRPPELLGLGFGTPVWKLEGSRRSTAQVPAWKSP